MKKSSFAVHPTLDEALTAVDEDELPDDIDAHLPPQRRMSSTELVGIGRLCATHVAPFVSKANRAEFERLVALVDRFLAEPPAGATRASDPKGWRDLGPAARRDAEHARGALQVAALAAWACSESGVDAARIVGRAARITAKTLRRDRAALHAFVRALCAKFC